MPRFHKVGVLTFHRCINYGSYWQARAMVEGLRHRGHDAVLLDHQAARVTRAEWRNAFQPVRPRRTARGDFRSYAAKMRKFLSAFEDLPKSAPFDLDDPETMEPCDAVVVGSDEVWNFRHPWYAACPLFFGEGIRAGRVIAYAGSFGCHDAGDGLSAEWARRLRRFDALSVRDDNSRRLLREGLGQDATLVLDPCLQFDAGQAPLPDAHGDVVVYGYDFPPSMVAAVRAWARRRGARLVSLGYRNDWADEQRLADGPDEFAQAMAGARAIVTNYFHGCVFAVLNGKPFVCAATRYRSHKIEALMRTLSTESRLVREGSPEDACDEALERPLGAAVEERLAVLRRQSAAYLDHALA